MPKCEFTPTGNIVAEAYRAFMCESLKYVRTQLHNGNPEPFNQFLATISALTSTINCLHYATIDLRNEVIAYRKELINANNPTNNSIKTNT